MISRNTLICSVLLLIVGTAVALQLKEGSQCLEPCTYNNDCTDIHCAACHGGRCVRGKKCGDSCTVNTDCDQASNCTQCTQGVCTKFCGQKCHRDKECTKFGCDACEKSVCTLWRCNAICFNDGGCASAPEFGCQYCDINVDNGETMGLCRSGCGQRCTMDVQCGRTCPYCANKTCGTWP